MALPGCAFQNPDNRKLWNAFEANLVPEEDTPFYCALPLTIPGGVLAIVIDVVVVHPFSIIDDAWGTSTQSWDDLDWQADYWFEAGVAPIRGAFTAVRFVTGLVNRALFDVPAFQASARSQETDAEPKPLHASGAGTAAEGAASARSVLSDWLQSLLGGSAFDGRPPTAHPLVLAAWDDELQALSERVQTEAPVRARIAYYTWAFQCLPPGYESTWLGLTDDDPRVRATMLVLLAKRMSLPDHVRQALLDDDDPVVAELAWQLLKNDSNQDDSNRDDSNRDDSNRGDSNRDDSNRDDD